MQERKCFGYRGFGYIIHNYRNMESRREEESTQIPSNKFEVLISRVMNMRVPSRGKLRKDRKTILREEKLKERKKEEKKEKPINMEEEELLREITVKIELQRIDIWKGIIVEGLLNSREISLIISLEFVGKKEFKLKKIERPIYVRNVDMSGAVHTGVEVCEMDLQNDLSFSLCTMLSVYCIVITSDDRKKSEMKVSADLVYRH